jgi:carbonic anhydrase/acetyltransferase-like protein (isoleucine patch superfamily)
MIFDFGDGLGLVKAHQHPNGGGWVANTARVEETVFVGPEARVYGNAEVYGEARVFGEARVYDKARVFDRARVFGNTQISDIAEVYDVAMVSENAVVGGSAKILDTSEVGGNAMVYGIAQVRGGAKVFGDSRCSKTPIVLNGVGETITITDNLIHVGNETPSKLLLERELLQIVWDLARKHQGDRITPSKSAWERL